ncbi:MAG: TIGR03009 domain-containing protein [Pirellulaceae bacterium]
MTRLLIGLSFLLSLIEAAPLLAQTTNRPAGIQAGPQAAPTRAVPAQRQPVRQVNGDGPIRQPLPVIAPAVAAPAGPQQPSWIPLAPDHEKWVGDVLRYWEGRSDKIKALSCEFTRWEYDPVFGPQDPGTPKTIAKGVIKYAQPDKGAFEVKQLSLYTPPAKAGDKPQYVPQDAAFSEHWVCDGKQIFVFEALKKQVTQRELPPEMQGKAIADGPLPFLFGARAETIKARYWVRGLPQSGNGKYWLEAVPKSRQDAQNFKAVTIVLDEKTYLPELLEVLAPNYDSKTNPAKTTYHLTNHDVTDDKLSAKQVWDKLNFFQSAFYAPKRPSGWTWVVERADGTTASPSDAQSREATRPAANKRFPSPLPR